MGFRFRRSVGLFPGLRLNFSKSGISASVGGRGARFTIGSKGTRITSGIPGTGLSWTEYTPYSSRNANSHTGHSGEQPASAPSENQPLTPIESAAPESIAALSTSELAPILNDAQRRMSLVPLVLVGDCAVIVSCLPSNSELFIGLALGLGAIFGIAAHFVDRHRRSVRVEYCLDAISTKVSDALTQSFSDLQGCSNIWNVTARGATSDWKRNAGAEQLLNRTRTSAVFKRPACIRGGVKFPNIRVGHQELYFLSDAMLIVAGRSVAALQYKDFSVELSRTKFIEDGPAPSDTEVLGHTWRFVNKKGGPDRRFKHNVQLPICAYGELALTSGGGLNCLLQLSNPDRGQEFLRLSNVLKSYDGPLLKSKSFKSITMVSRWPTVVLITAFVICGIVLSAVALWQTPNTRADVESALRAVLNHSSVTPKSTPTLQPWPQPILEPQPGVPGPAPLPHERPIRRP